MISGLFLPMLLSVVSSSDAVKPAVPVHPPAAVAFPLQDVHLLGGPLKHSQDIAAEYLLSLEPDRLLARFRLEAGLEKKAENYPGWETKELPGVALGFYLSGCSKLFATLGDKRFGDRVTYCLDELEACQQANGDGFLLATRNGKKLFSEIAAGDIRLGGGWMLNGEPEPYYAMEKLFSGLRDAYRHAGNRKALSIAIHLADWLDQHMAALNDAQLDRLIQVEYGGMNWVLADLYADTGDARYLALSKRWHDKQIEDPMAAGQDCLPGKHANTQFPKISGMAARFPYTGDTADRVAPEFFWDRVVNHHSYATGGNSEAEHFGPPNHLSDRLSPSTTELCNSYNMIRLSQLLFSIEPKSAYADYVEQVLFNHVLAAQHPDDARICYFTPLASGCPRTYQPLYDAFTCCTCSGLDSYAKHAEFIYMHNNDALYINLFAASEVYWKEKGMHVRQETLFPDEDNARFIFTCEHPVEATVHVRCPAWAPQNVLIILNDQPQFVVANPGSYAVIKRTWQTDDHLQIYFPMLLHVEPMPDNLRKVAIFAGPILLAAEADEKSPDAEDEYIGQALAPDTHPCIDAMIPVEGKSLEFKLTGIARPKDVVLQPFFRLHDKPYVVYWDVMSDASWTANQNAHADYLKKMADNIDRVFIGNAASEKAHALKSEESHTGYGAYGKFMQRAWRDVGSGGYFSYELAVIPGQVNKLGCTYWGGEIGPRKFEILINGSVIATESLDNNYPEAFYEVMHDIPAPLIADATKVTVMFRPLPGNTGGGLFGIRVTK